MVIDNHDKIDEADTLFIESTYGDRTHKSLEDSVEEFKQAIIPSFALEKQRFTLLMDSSY